jgi:beta-xylosidase
MVAIPAYFLAHAAYSSVASLLNEGATIPIPRRNATQTQASISAFATVEGPHVAQNFPDPAIIHVAGVSYSFATNNRKNGPALIHVQMASSTDNVTWTMSTKDALPNVGAWETGNRVWAPDVVELEDGTFVLYYSGEVKASPAHHCIGAATATLVMGPYTPQATPLACPDSATLGGAIDPDGFFDESTGRRYVSYKVDGNSNGLGGSCNNMVSPQKSTPIVLQEVAQDGITLIGSAIQILDRDKYDGPLIEAPAMYRSDEGIYFLFFSSNCFTGPLYDTSYATATNITGPYTKSARPLFITGDGPNLIGPGGMDIIKGGGMIVFHSHLPPITSGRGKNRKKEFNLIRAMYSAKATFHGHTVSLA